MPGRVWRLASSYGLYGCPSVLSVKVGEEEETEKEKETEKGVEAEAGAGGEAEEKSRSEVLDRCGATKRL